MLVPQARTVRPLKCGSSNWCRVAPRATAARCSTTLKDGVQRTWCPVCAPARPRRCRFPGVPNVSEKEISLLGRLTPAPQCSDYPS